MAMHIVTIGVILLSDTSDSQSLKLHVHNVPILFVYTNIQIRTCNAYLEAPNLASSQGNKNYIYIYIYIYILFFIRFFVEYSVCHRLFIIQRNIFVVREVVSLLNTF